jgi:YfiH family protein
VPATTDSALDLIRPATLGALTSVAAGFTTRHGGVSGAPFDALNLGFSTGDRKPDVQANRRLLAEAMGFEPTALAVAGQVHGDAVEYVTKGGTYPRRDALVTDRPGVLLCMMAADCASVLLADADAQVVAACHSGWRGTVAQISAKTVAAMVQRGAKPERIRAYVSPCIGVEAFEVGEEVASRFDPEFVSRDYDEPHVDLKAAIRAQLVDAGVLPGHIDVDEACTHSSADFFSFRREAGKTGRMMGVIGLVG